MHISKSGKYIISLLLFFLLTTTACSSKSTTLSSPGKTFAPQMPVPAREGWQSEWDKTLLEAKKEGRVVLLGGPGVAQAKDPFIRTVKERFGITLEVTIAGGSQGTAKIVNERRAGLYISDVYLSGATSILNDLIPRNILEPIEPYLILPEVKDPSLWFGGKLPYWEKKRVSLSTLASIPSGPTSINNSLLKPQEFTSYRDLLNQKLKGLLVMADPTTPGSGLSWLHLAYRLMGEDFIKELVKQEVVITRDFQLMSEWLARGKYTVALGTNTGGIKALIRDGAPINILPPFKEGVDIGIGAGAVSIIDKNPHPNATRVFANWLLSKEGQTLFTRAAGYASRRMDVPTDHLDAWQVLDPRIKYVIQDEDYTREEIAMPDIAREIFGPLLK